MQLVWCFTISITFIFCSLTNWKSVYVLSVSGNICCHKSFGFLQFFHVLDMGEWIHSTTFQTESFDCIEPFFNSGSFSPPAAAAFLRPCSLCWELPLHVCHGQASVCWGRKPHRWRNRPQHGAGNGRVCEPSNIFILLKQKKYIIMLVHVVHVCSCWMQKTKTTFSLCVLLVYFFYCYSGPL